MWLNGGLSTTLITPCVLTRMTRFPFPVTPCPMACPGMRLPRRLVRVFLPDFVRFHPRWCTDCPPAVALLGYRFAAGWLAVASIAFLHPTCAPFPHYSGFSALLSAPSSSICLVGLLPSCCPLHASRACVFFGAPTSQLTISAPLPAACAALTGPHSARS